LTDERGSVEASEGSTPTRGCVGGCRGISVGEGLALAVSAGREVVGSNGVEVGVLVGPGCAKGAVLCSSTLSFGGGRSTAVGFISS